MTTQRLDALRAAVVPAGLCVSLALLVFFGWRGLRDARHNAQVVAQERLDRSADLFVRALTRDMRGAQASVLLSIDAAEAALGISDRFVYATASAFARFPYVEFFFTWQGPPEELRFTFYDRYDRPARRAAVPPDAPACPVVVDTDPTATQALSQRLRADVGRGAVRSAFQMEIHGVPNQVVATTIYEGAYRDRVIGGVGFGVNLDWVRQDYFSALANQLGRASSVDGRRVGFAVFDDTGTLIAGAPAATNQIQNQTFPLLFADPKLLGPDWPPDLPERHWMVQAHANAEAPGFGFWQSNGAIMLAISAASTTMLAFAVILAARAARDTARVAEVRSDFIAAMTHDLKTPLATIRVIHESISAGRITDGVTIKSYAQMAHEASQRLTWLIENALAYARITDVADVYHFEQINLREVVEDSLARFSAQLTSRQFVVDLALGESLQIIIGDRTALGLAFDNIVDNAVQYASDAPRLSVRVQENADAVTVCFADSGIGIPADALPYVTRKFFRASKGFKGGAGLGLAIVQRVIDAHHGHITIDSGRGIGTTVTVSLPKTPSENA